MIKEQIAFSDIETIRRTLFDHGFLNRERDGSRYRKNERCLQGEQQTDNKL